MWLLDPLSQPNGSRGSWNRNGIIQDGLVEKLLCTERQTQETTKSLTILHHQKHCQFVLRGTERIQNEKKAIESLTFYRQEMGWWNSSVTNTCCLSWKLTASIWSLYLSQINVDHLGYDTPQLKIENGDPPPKNSASRWPYSLHSIPNLHKQFLVQKTVFEILPWILLITTSRPVPMPLTALGINFPILAFSSLSPHPRSPFLR